MNDIIIYPKFESFFIKKLEKLSCQEDTKSYIISVLTKYKNSKFDFSKDSITIQYSIAKSKNDFERFQSIGDWLFFISSIFPENLQNASEGYFHTIAQSSYYSCYRIINRQWILYEQMADLFPTLTKSVNKAIRNI
jgi:hypothetical protein